MGEEFNIIEYISGLTNFVFDKAVLKRIALERNVLNVKSFYELTNETRELLRADLLYTVFCSPNVIASNSSSHGGFTKTIGSQTISEADKKRLYDVFSSIYKKYDIAKSEEIEKNEGSLMWM